MSKEMFEYRVEINGLYGRNRSVKYTSFKLAQREKAMPDADVLKLASDKVADVKLKSGFYKVTEVPIEVDNRSGMEMDSRLLIDPRERTLAKVSIRDGQVVTP